jgi:hypothetical protein
MPVVHLAYARCVPVLQISVATIVAAAVAKITAATEMAMTLTMTTGNSFSTP